MDEEDKPDLSYLSNDQPDLSQFSGSYAGMPANLAQTAQANLSAPGVVAGTTGAVDPSGHSAAGMAILDPNHRTALDAPIAAVHPSVIGDDGGVNMQALNARRNAILQGTDPDAPALYVGAKRKLQLESELSQLTNVAHQTAMASAQQAHQTYLQNKDIQSAQAFGGLAKSLNSIEAPLGTPEHQTAVLQAMGDNGLALQTVAGRDLLSQHIKAHDQQAKILALANQTDPVAARQAIVTQDKEYLDNQHIVTAAAAKEGLTPNYDDEGNASLELTKEYQGLGDDGNDTTVPTSIANSYAKLQGQYGQHMAASSAQAEKDKKANLPNNPYADSAKLEGTKAAIAALEKQYPGLKPDDAPAVVASAPAPAAVASPEQIRELYRAGKLNKDEAAAQLQKVHGFK